MHVRFKFNFFFYNNDIIFLFNPTSLGYHQAAFVNVRVSVYLKLTFIDMVYLIISVCKFHSLN